MWPQNAIKKGFVAYRVYWLHLFAQFVKRYSPAFWYYSQTTLVWKYDKKGGSDPTADVTNFSPGIWQWLVAQGNSHPSRLRVSGCSFQKNLFPEGKTTTFWLKSRTPHLPRETSSLPTAGFTCAPQRCKTPVWGQRLLFMPQSHKHIT